ncbi:ABC transporter permease [Solibacillus merdavium]|uniref:ABC transporter permease n=1 Tax=Solibacillus merdavium TaxID=2762218 RepID=A0ABR8XKQ5_9BACL|nr:ABC transporter permease [Solibacillus merdavium]MBD8032522.1 ABC transporter permease [Solibacillus merdavium]
MWKYVSKRFGKSALALIICSFICFILIRQLPGSAAYSIYGANAQRLTEEEKVRIEQALLGNESLIMQYIQWIGDILRGDWGFSFSKQQNVLTLIMEQSLYTAIVVTLALIFTNILMTLWFYLLQRLRHKLLRSILGGLLLGAMVVPGFWLSFFLLWLCGVILGWFPIYGVGDGSMGALIYHAILPSIALALPAVYYGVKLLEDQFAGLKQQPFMIHLQRRGISRSRLARHVFPHVGLVYLQLNGYFVTAFIGGTIAVETVFSIPGVGKLTVEATKLHDYPTLLMIILVSLAVILVVQLLIDLCSCWIDPRVFRSLKD